MLQNPKKGVHIMKKNLIAMLLVLSLVAAVLPAGALTISLGGTDTVTTAPAAVTETAPAAPAYYAPTEYVPAAPAVVNPLTRKDYAVRDILDNKSRKQGVFGYYYLTYAEFSTVTVEQYDEFLNTYVIPNQGRFGWFLIDFGDETCIYIPNCDPAQQSYGKISVWKTKMTRQLVDGTGLTTSGFLSGIAASKVVLPTEATSKPTYILNTASFIIHRTGCDNVKLISSDHKATTHRLMSELLKQGYVRCTKCNPQ